jgi:hypothetical protein
MPYKIAFRKGQDRPWKILKEGHTVGSSLTKKDAEASIRAREMSEAKK